MNKEEKEAIEYIKAFQKDLYGASEKNLMAIYIDRVWNYIDKLQEENDKLKYNQLEADELIKGLQWTIEELEKDLMHWRGQYHLLSRKIDCISKDMIRNVIEKSSYPDIAIQKLAELLKEE